MLEKKRHALPTLFPFSTTEAPEQAQQDHDKIQVFVRALFQIALGQGDTQERYMALLVLDLMYAHLHIPLLRPTLLAYVLVHVDGHAYV